MQSEQIINEVKRYLEDENYRYAIMIDGNWGCGKTHFVLHDLTSAIKEYEEKNRRRDIKYISLYGCESVEDVEKNVYWSILDKKIFELKEQVQTNIPTKTVYGEMAEKREKSQRVVLTMTKKLVGTVMQKVGFAGKDFEMVAEFVSLNKHIFIFDDLERCDCPINDILGYINSLVEHESAKVILVANEKEIGQLKKREYREWQNLVAAQANILIPDKEPFGIAEKINKPIKEFSLDELERRRSKIFFDAEWDEQYKRIREKLIGVIIHYNPDSSAIMHRLISDFKGDKQLQEHLNGNVRNFINKMEEYDHLNFRTFQFFLSKIEYLYPKLDQINIDKNYKNETLKFIVQNCFDICVEFKANVNETENPVYGKKLRLQSIKEYVENSNLELDVLEKEIGQYIKEELFEKLPADDPLNQLYNKWYIMTQVQAEKIIGEIIRKLEGGGYHENSYRKILLVLMQLQHLGVSEQSLSQAVECIKKDLKQKNELLSEEWYMIEDIEFVDEYKQLVISINRELESIECPIRNETIENILEKREEWGRLLYNYVLTNETKKYWKRGVFLGIEAGKWTQIIQNSDAENLYYFRNFLLYALRREGIREGIESDIETVEKILESLGDSNNIEDLIKRYGMKLLINDLEKAKRSFESAYAEDYKK